MSDSPQAPPAPTLLLDEAGPLFAWLVSLERSTWGELYALPWEGITLGSNPMNDIVLHDPLASPMHARIRVLEIDGQPRCQIQDLASTYGTWVNGVRIVRHNLADNDFITFGDSHFCFKQLTPGS